MAHARLGQVVVDRLVEVVDEAHGDRCVERVHDRGLVLEGELGAAVELDDNTTFGMVEAEPGATVRMTVV